MIAAGQPFPAVAQQLLAARGSLDSLLVRLVALELRDRVPDDGICDQVGDLLRTALGRKAGGRVTGQWRDEIRVDPASIPQAGGTIT